MTLTFLLGFCATCTILGFTLMYLLSETEQPPEPILEMDYDPEEICIVCDKKCDNYGHWTHGG